MPMFKSINRNVKTYVEVSVELHPDHTPMTGENLRRAALEYAETQMEGYKFNKIINHGETSINILMEKIR